MPSTVLYSRAIMVDKVDTSAIREPPFYSDRQEIREVLLKKQRMAAVF